MEEEEEEGREASAVEDEEERREASAVEEGEEGRDAPAGVGRSPHPFLTKPAVLQQKHWSP